ncbi:MAG: T9SS type A sorting domain-containing protein [Ignavibacterium sp.]|nr:T9SS type A sorting domain-containing protein [Ignavibacterium sp.]MDW8374396.1 T9SS type A sorting domain-containing protein [Ignavibacteriales bacterium]
MKKFYFPSVFFLSLIFSGFLLPQIDNPLYDHVPIDYIRYIEIKGDEPVIESVVTDSLGFDNFNLGVAFAEPHMSQNLNSPLQYFNAFNTNTAYRTYDGLNWITSTPSFGATLYGDPVTAYDSLGNLYYQNMSGSGTIQNARVIRSTDNGQTWTASVIGVNGIDKNWMAADQTNGPYKNYIYCTMTGSGGVGNFSRSTDFGATFQQTATFNTQTLPGMMVAVGPNVLGGNDIPGGCVYVVTNSGSAFASTYTFYVSTNGGQTFTLKSAQNFANYVGTNVSGRNSVQNMRTRPYPFIAADNSYGPYRGRLYLVYASNTPAGDGNKPDIFLRYSDDQGATWSSAKVVNDDPNTTANHQWHPALWVDKTSGRVFIKWMDTRDTPTSDSAHIYATYSSDGGNTFAPNQRITTAKMRINCTTCGGGGTPRYQGDYDAIVAHNNISNIVWTDFRAGNFGSYTAYFPDYALRVSPQSQVIENNNDTIFYKVEVPAVKLYDQSITFSASISPTPAQGSFQINFLPSNVLTTYPDSVKLRIITQGLVSVGNYTITITANGPFGPPIHRRTVQMTVDNVIPVELVSFDAIVEKNDVMLNWVTATELNNLGFDIERKIDGGEFESIGFLRAKGTSSELTNYKFIDRGLNAGKYFYRLKQKDFDGTFDYLKQIEVNVTTPMEYALEQNYPNPFGKVMYSNNPTTTIKYSIKEKNHVSLKVYDILGNLVANLVDGVIDAGNYELKFDGSNLSSGVYYYSLTVDNFSSTKKFVLVK